MSDFTPDELDRVGRADEVGVSSVRPDGTDRPFVTIWAVRVGDALYVRSAYGVDNPWYRRAIGSGAGRVKAGGADLAVAFARLDADDPLQTDVDAAYHAKYDRYGARIVGTVVGEHSYPSTLRLDPR